MDPSAIQSIVTEVMQQLGHSSSAPVSAQKQAQAAPAVHSSKGKRLGVYTEVASAVNAAREAQDKLRQKGIAARTEAIQLIKDMCVANAEPWGKMEFNETRIGRLEHKIEKLMGIPGIPGVEWLSPYGMSGDHGIAMEEQAPFGVIAAISPVTHSVPTIAANAISMIASGNSIVVNAHPGGKACAAHAVAAFNEALESKLGLGNLVTIIEEPTLESFNELTQSNIDLICVTGGPAVVKAAMQSGKRAICAGPGNPPVVVDQTADLDRAARSIIFGGAYDNNLLCIGEKQAYVVESVFDGFLAAMQRAGAVMINDKQLDKLTAEVFDFKTGEGGCSHPVLKRELVGADASVLARHAGASAANATQMLMAITDHDHAFVQEEQMMPMLPVVKVKDSQEAIALAKDSEHGYKHSAIIHSKDVDTLTYMGQVMDCTLYVKNGSSLSGLGVEGEGYANFSIATTTGEGIVTPATFTRKRRCVMVNALNIIG